MFVAAVALGVALGLTDTLAVALGSCGDVAAVGVAGTAVGVCSAAVGLAVAVAACATALGVGSSPAVAVAATVHVGELLGAAVTVGVTPGVATPV